MARGHIQNEGGEPIESAANAGHTVYVDINNLEDGGTSGLNGSVNAAGDITAIFLRGGVNIRQIVLTAGGEIRESAQGV